MGKVDPKAAAGRIIFSAALIAIILINWFGPGWIKLKAAPSWLFVFQAALFLGAVVGAGWAIKGHWLGAVIDSRNRLSLSKLQMLLWTVLVISAIATLVTYGLATPGMGENAVNIDIPGELLAAMGIAATSLVAAPAVLSLKPEGTHESVGVNASVSEIRLVDLVQGDEEGNRNTIDLSKLQQFAITLMLLGVYGATLFHYLGSLDFAGQLDAYNHLTPTAKATAHMFRLPPFTEAFLGLMGLSHAGYLLYKAAPKPDTGGVASAPPPSGAPSASTPDGALG